MGVKVSNNAFGTLSAGISSSDTTITLDSGQGARFPTLGAGDYFFGTLVDTANNLEIVKVTARSSDSMTVVRGQDDTTAQAFAIGDRFELRPTAALFEAIQDEASVDGISSSSTSGTAITIDSSNNTTVEEDLTVDGDTTTKKILVSGAVGDTNDTPVDISGTGIYDGVMRIRNTTTTDGGSGFFVATRPSWSLGNNLFGIGYGAPNSADVALYFNSDKQILTPHQPSFLVFAQSQVSDISTGSGSPTIVNWSNVSYNTGSHFNLTNNTFTAPIAGRYLMSARVTVRNEPSRWVSIAPVVNGSNYTSMNYWDMKMITDYEGNPPYVAVAFTAVFNLSANDTFKVGIFSNTATDTWDEGSYFSGHLLG